MKSKRNIFKAVIIALAVFAAVLLMTKFNHSYRHNYHFIIKYINSFGRFAVLAYIILFSIRTLLIIFPYSIMVILGGSIFGAQWGFLYSLISVFISSTLAYYVSKFSGKDFVQKLLRGKMKQLDSKVEQHGFKLIFFMRISTLFPFDILNFAAGLTEVKYKDFILATMLGIIPETFSLSYLGHNLKNPFSPKFIFAIILIILTIAVPFLYNKIKKSKEQKEDDKI